MTSYIMYDILKPSVIWKIWQRGAPTSFLGGRPRMAMILLCLGVLKP